MTIRGVNWRVVKKNPGVTDRRQYRFHIAHRKEIQRFTGFVISLMVINPETDGNHTPYLYCPAILNSRGIC